MQGKAATQTLSIVFPQRLVVMDLVPFAPSKLGRVSNPEAPITQRALARLEPQPELRHLDVCLRTWRSTPRRVPCYATCLRHTPARCASRAFWSKLYCTALRPVIVSAVCSGICSPPAACLGAASLRRTFLRDLQARAAAVCEGVAQNQPTPP